MSRFLMCGDVETHDQILYFDFIINFMIYNCNPALQWMDLNPRNLPNTTPPPPCDEVLVNKHVWACSIIIYINIMK